MMERKTNRFALPGGLLAAFALWTAAVCLVDVQSIGPLGSRVGFAALNGWFHNLTGVHLWLYDLTDLLSVVPLGLCAAFVILGLSQWGPAQKAAPGGSGPAAPGRLLSGGGGFFRGLRVLPREFPPGADRGPAGGLLPLLHHPAGAVCYVNRPDAAAPPASPRCPAPHGLHHAPLLHRLHGPGPAPFRCPLAHRYPRRRSFECGVGHGLWRSAEI